MAERPEAIASLERLTTAHYDSFPFEFLTPADEQAIEAMQPPPFRTFVESFTRPGDIVGEIGCGPGRGTMYLCRKAVEIVAVDISQRSLELAQDRAPGARFVRATNLDLPFGDGTFDRVVSDGVIHHTPDARRAFRENARVLRPHGYLYLGVYRRGGHYYYIYTFAGPPIRWLERNRLGRWAVMSLVFPVYYLAHLIKSRGTRTLRGARNFFYDYIITPRASFHSRDEIEAWAREEKLEVLSYDQSLGNVSVFVLRKR